MKFDVINAYADYKRGLISLEAFMKIQEEFVLETKEPKIGDSHEARTRVLE